jgi:hypothetical protein
VFEVLLGLLSYLQDIRYGGFFKPLVGRIYKF